MSREMKESGIDWIGSIPESWNTIKFKYLHGGMNTGEGIDKNFWSNEPTDRLFYTAGINPIRTNYEDFPEWKYTKENDLLLARNGTPYIYIPYPNACYTDHIIRATMNESVNKRFVQYGLQCSIASVVVDSVSLATWSASLWNKQVIAWPSAEEQERIVSFLDEKCAHIDSVLEKTRNSIEEYKKLKQAVITQTVTKGIRTDTGRIMKDSGIKWIGEMPDNWKLVPFRRILKERNEKNSPIKSKERLSLSIDLGVTLYSEKTTNLDRFKENFEQYKMAHKGDLVMNSMNMIVGASGQSKYYGCVSPAYYTFYDETEDHCTAKFCEYVFRSKTMLRILFSLGKGIYAILRGDDKVNTCRLKVSKEDLKSIVIPVPPLEEQREITTFLNEKCNQINKIIEKKEQFISELEKYKKSLIYEYVTGKKEVPEP